MKQTTFTIWLRQELGERGMSQSDLARACKSTPSYISYLMSGNRNPGSRTLMRIAHVLQVPIYLVFDKAGLLTQDELSPIKRTLVDLIKQLPDSDVEALIALAAPVSVYRI